MRQVEDILFERGIDICHETVRYGWNRFRPLFAAGIWKRRVHHGAYSNWRWHLDEVFVRVNGEIHYLRRAVGYKGEVIEVFATKRRNRAENSHQPFRRREGAMAKFRALKTLQKFASVHASIHNHFNHERHLNRRYIFKQDRAAALAEWRQLAA